jgi:hypothetical protein
MKVWQKVCSNCGWNNDGRRSHCKICKKSLDKFSTGCDLTARSTVGGAIARGMACLPIAPPAGLFLRGDEQ